MVLIQLVQWHIFFCDAASVSHSLLNDRLPETFQHEKLSRVKDMCEAAQVQFAEHPANVGSAKLLLHIYSPVLDQPGCALLHADICEFCLKCLLDNSIKFCDGVNVKLCVKHLRGRHGKRDFVRFEVTDWGHNLDDGHCRLWTKFGEWQNVQQGGLQLKLWSVRNLTESVGGYANFHWTKRSHGRTQKLATWWFQESI